MSNSKIKDERFKINEKFLEKEEEEQEEISDLNQLEEKDENSIKEYDIIDDAISENLDEEKNLDEETLENYREKVRRSGVIYISYIPEGMTVISLKKKLSNYGVNRVYLVPDTINKSKSKNKQNYKEGWIEFTDKIMAKLCEYELNGKIFGGKKRNNKYREEIWNLKYLHKFKWNNLMEKLQYNKKLREHRMKAELSQIKRENNFILDKFEQSRKINNLNRKRVRFVFLFFVKFFEFFEFFVKFFYLFLLINRRLRF